MKGIFRIGLKSDFPTVLRISFVGLYTKLLEITDTTRLPVTVIMKQEPWIGDGPVYQPKLNAIIWTTEVNRMDVNFNSYSELIPQYRELLSKLDYGLEMLLAGYYRNFYGAFGYGWISTQSPQIIDSLLTTTSASKISFRLGYGFHSKHSKLIFTPFFAFDMINYKLQTRNENFKIPLSSYLQTKYYDIRFNQWIGRLGGDFDIRLFSEEDRSLLQSAYLSVGAGYCFKLSKRPLIQSSGNELISSGRIDYNNLFLQVSFKFYAQKN
jgi:hypothetical protein